MTEQRSPALPALLAFFVPGAGQLYNGERSKAYSLFCMLAGIGFAYWYYRASVFAQSSVFVLQLILMLTACADAYAVARHKEPVVDPSRRWSVIAGLMIVGPFALPLLWQSPRFSKLSKWTWTVGVILFAVVATMLLGEIGEQVEKNLEIYRVLLQ